MLSMQHSTFLPQGNNLPVSDAALRAIEHFLVKPIVYHVCPNDCIVFMGQHAQLSECPKCGASRYISENSATPLRTFTYYQRAPDWSDILAQLTLPKSCRIVHRNVRLRVKCMISITLRHGEVLTSITEFSKEMKEEFRLPSVLMG